MQLWDKMVVVVVVVMVMVMMVEVSTSGEVVSLEHLYVSTRGPDWNWRLPEDTTSSDVVWNFTKDERGEYVHDPCSTLTPIATEGGGGGRASWQGVTCTAEPAICSLQSI